MVDVSALSDQVRCPARRGRWARVLLAGLVIGAATGWPTPAYAVAAGQLSIIADNGVAGSTPARQAPAAPTGLSATPGNASATLIFTPGSDGGSEVTGYEVSTDGGDNWTTLAISPGAGATRTGTVTGLTNGTTYSVKVRALNNVGTGAPSAAASVTPATLPAAPTGLSATPGNASATLSFTPGSDGGSPVTGYQVSTDGGTTWTTLATTASGSTETGTITGLTNGTPYPVKVRAVNSVGTGAATPDTTVTPVAVALTPIQVKYNSMGGPDSFLGSTVGPEFDVAGGQAQRYDNGWIYWSEVTGAHEVHGAIGVKYGALGDVTSLLGFPTTDETESPGGRVSAFTGGSVYWSPTTPAHEVHGLILAHYAELGGPGGLLGYPLSDETTTPDGVGRYNHFQNGSIYWTPGTGAHEVHGAIRAHWAALGWEGSLVGYPTSDESDTPGGRVNTFTGARIYWSAPTGAYEVHGEILDRYLSLGGTGGFAGFPVTDETDIPGVPGGRMSVFSATNVAVYWSADTRAHETYGAIRGYYTGVAGGPAGRLGLPTSGEYDTATGRASDFRNGTLNWNAATGQVEG
jgi:uncharacterized protein with LGFP repeats